MNSESSQPNARDDTRVESFLAAVNFEQLAVPESLAAIGRLIDLASDLERTDALELALEWVESLSRRTLSSSEEMTLQYFRGNAWLDLYADAMHTGTRDKHDWSQPELKNAVLALRSVAANEALLQWPLVRRAQLYTNLGNALSTLGRSLAAIAYRNSALSTIPHFGMALGTRAETIDAFRGVLYRPRDVRAYVVDAVEGFAAATAPEAQYESADYGPVRQKWSARLTELRDWLAEHAVVAESANVTDRTAPDAAYRKWNFEERLVLNPLNDLGRSSADAMLDDLHLPAIAPHDAKAELLYSYLDAMRQELSSARWTLYEALTAEASHFSDDLSHHDTRDEPLYVLRIERIKSAYRIAHSIFDKVALFINVYFEVGMPVRAVTFSTIWGKEPADVRPLFSTSRNWPLRGLYWISRDLGEKDFKDVMEPDARGMAELRNHIEHRFVRVVGKPGHSGVGAQGLLYTVTEQDLRRRTLSVLRLAREALIMLVSAVYVEERRRGPRRGPLTRMGRL